MNEELNDNDNDDNTPLTSLRSSQGLTERPSTSLRNSQTASRKSDTDSPLTTTSSLRNSQTATGKTETPLTSLRHSFGFQAAITSPPSLSAASSFVSHRGSETNHHSTHAATVAVNASTNAQPRISGTAPRINRGDSFNSRSPQPQQVFSATGHTNNDTGSSDGYVQNSYQTTSSAVANDNNYTMTTAATVSGGTSYLLPTRSISISSFDDDNFSFNGQNAPSAYSPSNAAAANITPLYSHCPIFPANIAIAIPENLTKRDGTPLSSEDVEWVHTISQVVASQVIQPYLEETAKVIRGMEYTIMNLEAIVLSLDRRVSIKKNEQWEGEKEFENQFKRSGKLVNEPGVSGEGSTSGTGYKRIEVVPIKKKCTRCDGYGFTHGTTDANKKHDTPVGRRCKNCKDCSLCNKTGALFNTIPCTECQSAAYIHVPLPGSDPNTLSSPCPQSMVQGDNCSYPGCKPCTTCKSSGVLPNPKAAHRNIPAYGWTPHSGLIASVVQGPLGKTGVPKTTTIPGINAPVSLNFEQQLHDQQNMPSILPSSPAPLINQIFSAAVSSSKIPSQPSCENNTISSLLFPEQQQQQKQKQPQDNAAGVVEDDDNFEDNVALTVLATTQSQVKTTVAASSVEADTVVSLVPEVDLHCNSQAVAQLSESPASLGTALVSTKVEASGVQVPVRTTLQTEERDTLNATILATPLPTKELVLVPHAPARAKNVKSSAVSASPSISAPVQISGACEDAFEFAILEGKVERVPRRASNVRKD